MCSLPFYAILFAHMGQNYGYETLMTELPTYMKQVLRFSIKVVSSLSWTIHLVVIITNATFPIISRRMDSYQPCPTWPCGFAPYLSL